MNSLLYIFVLSLLFEFLAFLSRWEEVFSRHDTSSRFLFESQSSISGNLPTLFRRDFVLRESDSLHTLGDSTSREFGKSREEEFFLAHVVSEIMEL